MVDKDKPVRVQWDPERTISLEKLPYRSIQIGVGKQISEMWVKDGGIIRISDVTGTAKAMKKLLDEGKLEEARVMLPTELVYPLPEGLQCLLQINERSC